MVPAPDPMLLEDALDLAAIYNATGRTAPAQRWIEELREALADAGIEAAMP